MAKERKYEKKDFIELTSEFNMSKLDMERIDIILKRCDDFSLLCGEGKIGYLTHYLIALRAFYRYLRPLMNKHHRELYDLFFNAMFKELYVNHAFNWTSYRKIEILHNELLDSRQMLGLGVWASHKREIAEKDLNQEFR